MKRAFIYIFLLLIISCTRTNTFKITGIIENIESGKIYLDEQEIEKIQPLDSVRISKKGKFTFKGHTAYPKFYHLHLDTNLILPLLIGPGEDVFIKSTKTDFPYRYEIEGSEGSQYIKDLNNRLLLTRKKLDSLQNLINNTTAIEDIRQSELVDEYTRVIEDQRNFSLKFILDHLTSMASIYAIYQKLNNDTYVLYKNRDIQILKITGAALDTIYPESGHVRSLVANAANLEQQLRATEIQKLINEGYSENEIVKIMMPVRQTFLEDFV